MADATLARGRELNRLEVLRGLRISTREAAASAVWQALTTGAFLTGFALWLGADSMAMGLVTAIPTLAGLMQVVSSYFGERLPERRKFTAWFSLAGRALWLPILLLPWFLPRHAALYGFLGLYALSYLLLNVPAPAFMSWMSDLVPADYRGRFFARRNMIAGLVSMGISLPAAAFLDYAVRRRHTEAFGFSVLFGVGVIGGIFSFAALMRQPEPPMRPAEERPRGLAGVLAYYRTPFADPNFRRLMLFNAVFGTGQFFAAPFYNVYALQRLHLDYVWLQVYSAMSSLATLASMPLWGYLNDRFGNKPLLIIGVCGVFSLPISWMLTLPHEPYLNFALLTEVNLLGAVFWAVVGLAQFNLLIGSAPPERTSIYAATMASVTGLVGGIAPLAGGVLMRALAGWRGRIFGLELVNFHVTFFVSAMLRLVSLVFLRPVADPGASSARDVLRQLRTTRPRAWASIRRLQRPAGEETRLRATEALAQSPSPLATAELHQALRDPSYAVRQEAARALAEMAEAGSVQPLVEALLDPATGTVAEAAFALGRIGDAEAVPALSRVLRSPQTYSPSERIAAALALGEIGGPDAVEVLLARLNALEECTPGELEAMLRALGRAHDATAASAIVARVVDESLPASMRAAAARALADLAPGEAEPALLQVVAASAGDVALVPAVADALARIGDAAAIEPLVAASLTLPSSLARSQVAVAIGGLIGEGETVYSLLAMQPMDRDAAAARLLEEIRRHADRHASRAAASAARDAFVDGDYGECVRRLYAAVRKRSEPVAMQEPADSRARGLRALAALATAPGEQPVESALLALAAARGILVSGP